MGLLFVLLELRWGVGSAGWIWLSIRIWGGGYRVVLDDYLLVEARRSGRLGRSGRRFLWRGLRRCRWDLQFAGAFDDAIEGAADMGAAEVP